jgi:4-alpha-glucanotransferase
LRTRVRGLPELRRLFQIESGYIDMKGNRQTADPEATLLVLRALGADLGGGDDVARAIHARRHELAHIAVQPVHVAWNGVLGRMRVRLPHDVPENVAIEIRLESGDIIRDHVIAQPARSRSRNNWHATHALPFQRRLPHGYHTISIDAQCGTLETFVIAAPRRAFVNGDVAHWGAFVPLYALCSSRNWGIGDYTDLHDAAQWAASLGASFLGTLPLLATFLEAPFEPSPYSPASRLFWNELFVDITCTQTLLRSSLNSRRSSSTTASSQPRSR